MLEVKLMLGDCRERMGELASGSIDLTVTSPPYDNLRTYNGNNDQWGECVWKPVLADLYRVTKQGGVVVWVVGDATIKGSETGTSFRQALWAMECGFNLHDTMIYGKSSQPRQNGYRYEQQFEYMFVFSKGRCRLENPIREETKNAGKVVLRTCRDGGKDILSKSVSRVADMKIKGNIWFYGVKENHTGHPAIFPEQLAHDHIISWSNEGGMVLDPFMGSGTTGKMAKLTNRNFIGIELDPLYFQMAQDRLEGW